ncbi:MAG: hypothetical protein V3G42_15930 [Oscillospiraceae bacterium]
MKPKKIRLFDLLGTIPPEVYLDEEFCDGGAFFEFYQGIDNKGNIIYRTLAEHEERR